LTRRLPAVANTVCPNTRTVATARAHNNLAGAHISEHVKAQ